MPEESLGSRYLLEDRDNAMTRIFEDFCEYSSQLWLGVGGGMCPSGDKGLS